MPSGHLISLLVLGITVVKFSCPVGQASPWLPLSEPAATQCLRLKPQPSLQIGSSAQMESRNRGIQLFRENKFPEAAKVLKRVVKEDKTDYEAWYYLGLALLPEGKNKDAAQAFETAIAIQPRFKAAHTGLAYAALQRRKSSEAVLAARAALNIDPTMAEPHYIIGMAHLIAHDPNEALNKANVAVRLNPHFAPTHFLKSQALIGILAKEALDGRRFAPASVRQPTPEELSERLQRRKATAALYKDAAASLQTYLNLNPQAPSGELLHEQLQTLEVYGAHAAGRTDPSQTPLSADEVTTKARVTFKPEPAYTEAARKARVVGTVALRAMLSANGTVQHILVLSSLPNGLTEAAVRAARMIKFVPATVNGRPVSMLVQIEYQFNLY